MPSPPGKSADRHPQPPVADQSLHRRAGPSSPGWSRVPCLPGTRPATSSAAPHR